MNFSKYLLGVAFSLLFAGCGGGGGNASAPAASAPAVAASAPDAPASSPVVIPAIVEVLASSSSLLTSGTDVVVTAFVKNSGNVGLAGQTVVFTASSGSLSVATPVTDLSGAVTAKLSPGSDKSVRDITVTVTAGGATGSIVVPVTGTKLSMAGSGSLQAGGTAATYTVRAADASGSPIRNAQLTVKSGLNNSISPAALPLTDATGTTTFLYTPNSAGSDTLTISGLGTTVSSSVSVSAVDFVVRSPASNTSIAIGVPQTVTVQYKLSGSGVVGLPVTFSTTRGNFVASETVTDVNGQASAVVSSTTAGSAVVVAQISGVGTVNVPIQFVATTPASIIVQANPGSVSPNLTGTTNQSTIEAFVRDANGNAVANRQVNFTALQDLSNGSLSPGIATTDLNGRASVQFIAGATSTQSNGVEIQAEVASTAIRGTTKMTVSGKSLFITIGFGNTISNLDDTTYSKLFTVYVTDANGVAVGNQVVNLSVIPTQYLKGFLTWQDPVWAYSNAPSVVSPTSTCLNEDLNLDGILDAGEDTNLNGLLTPGNIAFAAPGAVTTDGSGRAVFAVQYGEQFAPWATVRISARASVSGTESRNSILYSLNGLADDFTKETVAPAGRISPFGISSSCTDAQ